MFVDRAKVHVKAGDGGNGCLAFRREKFVPRGGPSGGNGGCGGNVVIRATEHLNTLMSFRFQQHFTAKRGEHGAGNNRQGREGDDVVLEVPVGTQVYQEPGGLLLFDLTRTGQSVVVARGGRGGRGNAAFATATNQAPRRHEPGEAGEELVLLLELKILADVGLVGYPNAGKSTLISVLSAAKPKIADYPFTTLSPNLGVVTFGDFTTLVLADIPGLIEGAHEGSGLGDQFLRHIERCHILVHLVDVSELGPDDPVQAVAAVNEELQHYDVALLEKTQVIVASKMDLVEREKMRALEDFCREKELRLCRVSAVTGEGIETLKRMLEKLFKEHRS